MKYNIKEKTVELYFTNKKGQNFTCLIDLEDLDKVLNSDLSWHISYRKNTNSYYVVSTKYLGIKNNKPSYKTIMFHHYILNIESSKYVDHINHNTLDDRKENLRITQNKFNSKNRKGKNKNNSTGYRNVCYFKGEYLVQLQIDGKNTLLGKFDEVEEAGRFAEEMRNKYYGKFAGKS